jgi:hypothetical protein
MIDLRQALMEVLQLLMARTIDVAPFEPGWAESHACWIMGLAEGIVAQLFSNQKTAGRGMEDLTWMIRGTWSEMYRVREESEVLGNN